MTRVLVLCEYPSLNGGERSLLEAVKHIDTRDLDLLIAAPGQGPLADALRQYGIPHRPLEIRDQRGVRLPRSILHERLARLANAVSADVVHANSLSMSRLSGPVMRAAGVPSIGHLRDIMRLSRSAIEQLNCHRRLLAVSSATRDGYTSSGLDPRKTIVEFNGVDLRRFQPRSPSGFLHAELGLARDARLVGSIGQIGMRKGVDLFLEAARFVAGQMADVHFVIVGKRYSDKQEAREFEVRVRHMAATAPLANRVHFLGLREDVHRLLGELQVYVHAARQEPLGRVLLEAAATGVPIVATDVGGTREIFPEELAAAVIVRPGSAAELGEAMADVLANAEGQRGLGSAARRRAESCFDVHDASRRLARHYLEVAN